MSYSRSPRVIRDKAERILGPEQEAPPIDTSNASTRLQRVVSYLDSPRPFTITGQAITTDENKKTRSKKTLPTITEQDALSCLIADAAMQHHTAEQKPHKSRTRIVTGTTTTTTPTTSGFQLTGMMMFNPSPPQTSTNANNPAKKPKSP